MLAMKNLTKFTSDSLLAIASGLSTLIGISAPTSAQTAFGAASYYVRHNFNWIPLNGTPNLVAGQVTGSARCWLPFNNDSYSIIGGAIGNPAGVSVNDFAAAGCNGASAFASSSATGVIIGNTISGSTIAQGAAYAFAPPGGFARAISSAALVAGQLGIGPFGRFTWRPLFGSYVSGDASAFAFARPRDPISYTVTDPRTGNVLRTGNLLDISGDFDGFGSIVEWGAIGDSVGGNVANNPVTGEDNQLDISFTKNGSFKIDLTDPAVVNPGLFDLACEAGIITRLVKTGRFSNVSTTWSIGDSCHGLSIPFDAIFPDELEVGFDTHRPRSAGNPAPTTTGIGEMVGSIVRSF
jgi:hypothetical protein